MFVELDVSCCGLSFKFCDCVSHFVFCLRSQGFVLGNLVSSRVALYLGNLPVCLQKVAVRNFRRNVLCETL